MITESLIDTIDRGREGKNQGYSMGLPKLEEIIDGVCKDTYTLLFADSGIGKSSIMLYSYLYRPLMDHLDDGKFKCTLFSLEMKAEFIMAKLLSTYIFEHYHIEISFKELLSRRKGYTLSDEYYNIVKECIPWMQKVEQMVTIYDKNVNAEILYAFLMKELKERGEFIETEHRKIYKANDPDLVHTVVIDHGGLLTASNGRTKKQEIDLVSHYLVTLKNMTGISPVMIMQANRDQSSSARRQLGFFLPQKSDVKETNGPVEDAEIILAVYNPANDHRATHNGYDIRQLSPYFRSIVCLKGRYGESNVEDGCVFYGQVNMWKELPRPDEIYDYSKYQTTDWLIHSDEENNENKITFKL